MRTLKTPTDQAPLGGLEKVRVAVAQASPVFLNKRETIKKAKNLISEASSNNAGLVVFPETWIPTYPYWTPAALGENDAKKYMQIMATLQDNSVRIPSEDTKELCEAARRYHIHVVIGCNEIGGDGDVPSSRTLYNSLLFIDDDGTLLGRHRKLMPTLDERLVWGFGDGTDLNVYSTKIGRIGGLICWENHMVLVRAAMILKGEEFHVAVWPGSWVTGKHLNDPDREGRYCDLYPAIREHAFEAGAFVVSAVPVITPEQVPVEIPYREKMLMNMEQACGGSAVVDPLGNYISGPTFNKEALLYADCEAESIKYAKAFFDALGHYARFDVVRLDMRADRLSPFSQTKRKLRRLTASDLRQIAEKYEVDQAKLEQIYVEITDQDFESTG
jgi:amidase/nitrilase